MSLPLTLDHLKQTIRTRICDTCANRTVALDGQPSEYSRPCEATCALFVHLPALRDLAAAADPMLGGRPARVRGTARSFGGAARRSASEVASTIEELLEP